MSSRLGAALWHLGSPQTYVAQRQEDGSLPMQRGDEVVYVSEVLRAVRVMSVKSWKARSFTPNLWYFKGLTWPLEALMSTVSVHGGYSACHLNISATLTDSRQVMESASCLFYRVALCEAMDDVD